MGFNPSTLYLLVNRTISDLAGFTVRLRDWHYFSMPRRILCAISQNVANTLPMMSITPSSVYPCTKTPCLLSHFRRLSATADHSVGDSGPPWGKLLLMVAVISMCPVLTHTCFLPIKVAIQFFTDLCIFQSFSAVATVVVGYCQRLPWCWRRFLVHILMHLVLFLSYQQVGEVHFLLTFLPGRHVVWDALVTS